ncbi:hypothetical protein HZC31_05875 [Candidatus Woesearchaeota archaeon]|nr:hypothetical protein [Candidatus Woesearchaeota archaeon]
MKIIKTAAKMTLGTIVLGALLYEGSKYHVDKRFERTATAVVEAARVSFPDIAEAITEDTGYWFTDYPIRYTRDFTDYTDNKRDFTEDIGYEDPEPLSYIPVSVFGSVFDERVKEMVYETAKTIDENPKEIVPPLYYFLGESRILFENTPDNSEIKEADLLYKYYTILKLKGEYTHVTGRLSDLSTCYVNMYQYATLYRYNARSQEEKEITEIPSCDELMKQ